MTIPILDKLTDQKRKAEKKELRAIKDQLAIAMNFHNVCRNRYTKTLESYSESQKRYIDLIYAASHLLARMQSPTMREIRRQTDMHMDLLQVDKQRAQECYEICMQHEVRTDALAFRYAVENYQKALKNFNESLETTNQHIERLNKVMHSIRGGNYEHQDQ